MSAGKRILTRRDIDALRPGESISVGPDTILTPFARDQALRRGVRIVESPAPARPRDAATRERGENPAGEGAGSSLRAIGTPPGPGDAVAPPAGLPSPTSPPEVQAWLDAGGGAAVPLAEAPRGYEAIQFRRPLPPPPRPSSGLDGEGALPAPPPASNPAPPHERRAAPPPGPGTEPPAGPRPSPAAARPAIEGARLLRENDGHLPESSAGGFPYTGREHLVVPVRVVGRCGQGVLPRLFETLESCGCRIAQVEHRAVQDFYEATVLVDLENASLDLASLHRKVQELQRPGECHVSLHAMAARSNPAPAAYPGRESRS